MKTQRETLTTYRHAFKAANEESPTSALEAAATIVAEHPAGWDPYEVWRTRIKALQDASNHGTDTP